MFTTASTTTPTAASASESTATRAALERPSGSRRSRRLTAALLAGPALTTAGLAVTPWEAERTTLAYHESLVAAPEQAQIAAVLLAFGYSLLGLAAFVVLRHSAGRLRRHRAIAATLSWLGATLMPGLLVTDWYDLALAQNLPAAQAAQVSEAAQALQFGALLFLPAIIGFIAGPLAVLTLAVRSGLVGRWAPVLAVLGIPLAMSSLSPVAMVASGLALLAAYGGVARGLALRVEGAERHGAAGPLDPALEAVRSANRSQRAV
jgi:hypothetical protein